MRKGSPLDVFVFSYPGEVVCRDDHVFECRDEAPYRSCPRCTVQCSNRWSQQMAANPIGDCTPPMGTSVDLHGCESVLIGRQTKVL